MLKVNLLPPYIHEKRKVKRAAILFGLLFVGLLAGLLTYYMGKNAELNQWQRDAADMQQQAEAVKALEGQVTAEKAKAPDIQTKINFAEAIEKYNLEAPKLYEEVARYTYNRVVYSSMSVKGNKLTMKAHARTLGDCGRFLLNMYRAKHLFSNVTISKLPVPKWPEGTQSISDKGGVDFTVDCTLINGIAAPGYGGSQTAPAATGPSAGMMPGMAPGMPGGLKSPAARPASAGGSESNVGKAFGKSKAAEE